MQKSMYIAGIKNLSGTGKQSGKPYSMFFVTALEPSLVQGPVVNASGFEAREMECHEQVFNQIKTQVFPVQVEAFLELTRDNKVKINSVRVVDLAKSSQPRSATA